MTPPRHPLTPLRCPCVRSFVSVAVLGCLLALAGGAGPLPAQELARETFALAEGLRLIRLDYNREDFRQRVLILEVEGRSRAVRVRAALGDGPWGGERIADLLDREANALAVWQALEQPRRGPETTWPGLVVVEGRLVAGPGAGPVLAVAHDGHVDLLDSAQPPGKHFGRLRGAGGAGGAGGLELRLDALNRRLTTSTLALVTDPGWVRDGPFARLAPVTGVEMEFAPVDSLAVRWGSGAGGARGFPAQPWPWASTRDGVFAWTAGWPLTVPADDQFPVGWTGVVGTGDRAEALAPFGEARATGELRLETHPAWQDYRSVVPLHQWLVWEGRAVVPRSVPEGDPRGESRARSAVALRREDDRLWFIVVLDGERQAFGMTEHQLAELCVALGATRAASGPEGSAVAAAVRDRELLPFRRSPDPARLALVVEPLAAYEAGSVEGWRPLGSSAPILVGGSPPLDWRVGPENVVDGRQGEHPTLDHFWASEGRGGAPPELVLRLSRESEVGQIDFVHAQSAGFSPELDVAVLRIESRAAGESEWRRWGLVENRPPRSRQPVVFDPPLRAESLRFVFEQPNSLPAGRIARLVEVVVWGRED